MCSAPGRSLLPIKCRFPLEEGSAFCRDSVISWTSFLHYILSAICQDVSWKNGKFFADPVFDNSASFRNSGKKGLRCGAYGLPGDFAFRTTMLQSWTAQGGQEALDPRGKCRAFFRFPGPSSVYENSRQISVVRGKFRSPEKSSLQSGKDVIHYEIGF